jgi:prephenate dehydrogenase
VVDNRPHSGVHRLAVIGVGMMGGSLALAAQERARVDSVVGYDTDREALETALGLGIIHETASSASEAAAYADLVVVSTPVRSIPGLVEECASAQPAPRLVTDTGSTKSAIMAALSPAARSLFIGGHPMCGAADSGVRYARSDLFNRATYFLCTTGAAFPRLYEMLQEFIVQLGAKPVLIDPGAHDRLMALVSHLPHVLANVLMTQAGSAIIGGKRALHCVGPSFKDLTRVAGANPPMWRDIFLENKSALADSLRSVSGKLEEFARLLESGDEETVAGTIAAAAGYREELLEFEDITPETLFKVTVRIPDQPGAVSRVMNTLGDASINVEDLTLHHVNRSVGGDLVLYIQGRSVAEQAAALLRGQGFPVVVAFTGESDE